ncbi:MAG: hypothetical protein ACRDF0_00560, partial [Candidatus Limnocylindria bacterium]
MIARARRHGAALWLLAATSVANVLAYGYQVAMARLLRPEEYAILTALFGILLVEAIGAQVIQAATAKLAAQYRAHDDDDALHIFVRRWTRRIALVVAPAALVVMLAAGGIATALSLSTFSVVLLGLTLALNGLLTFTLGLLQGLARYGWFGAFLILQAGARLTLGVVLVTAGHGVDGAFLGATAALLIAAAGTFLPLGPLFRAARAAVAEASLAPSETRFFVLSAVVLLAYAALT